MAERGKVLLQRVARICADLDKKPRDLAAMNKQEAKVFIHDIIDHLRTIIPDGVPRYRRQ